MIFLRLQFWPKVFYFGSMEDSRTIWGREKKTEGIFWVVKRGLRDFLGYANK